MILKRVGVFFIFFAVFSVCAVAQVIIAPYVVYMDEENRFGSYVVENRSEESFEISINLIFGYPQTDSMGFATMVYFENPHDSMPSSANWTSFFPKKFMLNPGQKQTIRMTVKPPENLKPGVYWTRIMTQAAPKSDFRTKRTDGITTRIKVVLNQVTTALYRAGASDSRISVEQITVKKVEDKAFLLCDIKRIGNAPFFGYVLADIYDQMGNKVDEHKEYIKVYYNYIKRFELDNKILKQGKYLAAISIFSADKEEIPDSRLKPIEPLLINYEFVIK